MDKALVKKIKLLITIAIIGGFAWVFVLSPMVTFRSNEKRLENAAKRYYELNSNELPTGERVGTVSLEKLYKNGLFDKDLFIPLTKKTCSVTNSWVKVKRVDGDYKYYTYLECGVLTSTIDHKGPNIKLNGKEVYQVGAGEKFKDPGISSVVDNKDGKLKIEDVVIKSNVDTSKVGEYEISYTAFDELKNKTTVTRKVVVVKKFDNTIKKLMGNGKHFTGNPNNNYVYFSNNVFRVVGMEGKNVKIIADKDIANVNFESIDDWLKFYESNLTKSAKKLIVPTKFCNMGVTKTTLDTTECSSYGDKKDIGIISIPEINRAYEGEENFIVSSTITWSANAVAGDKKQAFAFRSYFIGTESKYLDFYKAHNMGVRPVIVIKGDILIKGGDGTAKKPFILEDYIAPQTKINLNERYVGEYVYYGNMLWRIAGLESDGTTKVIAENTLKENGIPYEFLYGDDQKTYNPKKKGNIGYIINNETSKFIKTKYFVNHEIEVPIYKKEPVYKHEVSSNKYTVKFSAPNIYDMYSAASGANGAASYWFMNSSKSSSERPAMSDIGAVEYGMFSLNGSFGIRPVGYLNKDCTITNGKGTKDNPFMITK